MITNLRILDSEYQMVRIFGKFIKPEEYDVFEFANGLYDIVFTHRQLMQDDFESIKPYLKPTTKIVTDISIESGNIGSFLEKYNIITKNEPYDFYLISDTILSEHKEFKNNKFKLLESYHISFYAYLNELSDHNIISDKQIFAETHNGFMSLNNSCRLHRVYLFTQFLKRNLSLDKTSFLFTTGGNDGFKYNREVFINFIDELKNKKLINDELYDKTINFNLPKVIDLDSNNYFQSDNRITDLYKDTILNLVTENLSGMTPGDIYTPYIITFTEKTIKPFIAKQIPLFFALPGLLNILRKLGFDLFDDLINNSYDMEFDSTKRLDLILDELEKLLKMDLIQYKKDNKERFDKNYNLLEKFNKSGEELVKTFLYNEIIK